MKSNAPKTLLEAYNEGISDGLLAGVAIRVDNDTELKRIKKEIEKKRKALKAEKGLV